jgi:uncharacterized membrane protein
MSVLKPNDNVIHPNKLLQRDLNGLNKINSEVAVKITKGIGSMWTAYIFVLLTFVSLPAVLSGVFPALQHTFPTWLISASLIALISWIAQTFFQLVLLPVIMVGQNVIQQQQDAKAETDHKTLTYLANLQEKQMEELQSQALELKNQTKILELLKQKIKAD